MMSALGCHVPLVDESGEWVWTTDDAGEKAPEFVKELGHDFARSVGTHLADAALAALEDGEDITLDPFVVQMAPLYTPVDNGAFRLLFALDLFDVDPSLVVQDTSLCPEFSPDDTLDPGCVPNTTWRVRLGPVQFLTAPGELFPELFWGLPTDDPRWAEESADPKARGADVDSAFFPQHPRACDELTFAECADEVTLGECDCRKLHDWPYRLWLDPDIPPMIELLDAKYRFVIGNAGDHLGYVVPETDFHTKVAFLADFSPGDHYEETVAITHLMAAKLLAAQLTLD